MPQRIQRQTVLTFRRWIPQRIRCQAVAGFVHGQAQKHGCHPQQKAQQIGEIDLRKQIVQIMHQKRSLVSPQQNVQPAKIDGLF